jgi:hypothetical protein
MFPKYVKADTIKERTKTNQYEDDDHGKYVIGIESGYYRSSNAMSARFYCKIGGLALDWVIYVIIF